MQVQFLGSSLYMHVLIFVVNSFKWLICKNGNTIEPRVLGVFKIDYKFGIIVKGNTLFEKISQVLILSRIIINFIFKIRQYLDVRIYICTRVQ